MSYPILKTSNAQNVGWQVNHALASNPGALEPLNAGFLNLEKEIESRKGADWDEAKFLENVRVFERNMREDRQNGDLSRTRMEADFAEHFMSQVELVGAAALQDPDFWRYLSLFPYRKYIYRIEGDLNSSRYGGEGNRELVRWTLIRGFLWGSRTQDTNKPEQDRFSATHAYREARLASGLGEGWVREFYISQVIRRDWSYNKNTYLAFIDAVVESPALFDLSNEIRPTQSLGAKVSRIGANLYFPGMSQLEIKAAIVEEKHKLPSPVGPID